MAGQFLRRKIIDVARREAETAAVFAKRCAGDENGKMIRQGYPRLLDYFRVSAPSTTKPGTTYFDENAIRYLTKYNELAPMPHWCGIFALWAIRKAGMNVGAWKQGCGISSVAGFKSVAPRSAQPGDVGYVSNGFEHHFLIEDTFQDKDGIWKARTIEGNGDPNSNFNFKVRPLNSMVVYSIFA